MKPPTGSNTSADEIDSKPPKKKKTFQYVALCLPLLGLPDPAGSGERALNLAVETTAPFVMRGNGDDSGFDIELWEEIARELGLPYTCCETGLEGLFKDVVEGRADVAFSCITVTESRETDPDTLP